MSLAAALVAPPTPATTTADPTELRRQPRLAIARCARIRARGEGQPLPRSFPARQGALPRPNPSQGVRLAMLLPRLRGPQAALQTRLRGPVRPPARDERGWIDHRHENPDRRRKDDAGREDRRRAPHLQAELARIQRRANDRETPLPTVARRSLQGRPGARQGARNHQARAPARPDGGSSVRQRVQGLFDHLGAAVHVRHARCGSQGVCQPGPALQLDLPVPRIARVDADPRST